MADKITVGVIVSPHGLKGEIKVYPTTDDAKRFKKLSQVFLGPGEDMPSLNIGGVRFSGKFVILKFEGFDRIEDVEGFKGKALLIDRKDAVKLKKDEYFVADLIGLEVINDDGEHLGEIRDVIRTGANDVYVVRKDGKDLLLPAIKDCVLAVDLEKKLLRVHVMDGL